MDAGIRNVGTRVHPRPGDLVATTGRRAAPWHGSETTLEIPACLSGLRVALVHDWLTGMRGGEKCLEVLCRAFPDAQLYTLFHRRGSLSPAIESMTIRTSPLQRIPGVFRVVPSPAADHAAGRASLATQGRRPCHQPEPLRGQSRCASAGGASRLLLLHAHALRLAGPRDLSGKLVRSTDASGTRPTICWNSSDAGILRRPAA